MTINRRQDEFVTKHKEVLILRKRAQELRCDLDLIEIKLREEQQPPHQRINTKAECADVDERMHAIILASSA